MAVSDFIKKYFEPTKDLRIRDVVRELPGGVKQTAEKIVGGFQKSGQSFFRGTAGVGATLTGEPLTPSTFFQKELYGTDKPITARGFGEELGLKGMVASVAGFVLPAADLIPGGKVTKAGAVTLLKNANKADDAFRIFTKTMGVAKEVAEKYLDDAVKLTDTKQLRTLVDKVVNESQQVSRFVQKGKSILTGARHSSQLAPSGKIVTSKDTFFNAAKGQYVPERQKLHEKILDSFLGSKLVSESPTVNFITGTSGSGKSTYSKTVLEKRFPNALVVDSDLLKIPLGGKTPYFHDESSDLALALYNRAIEQGKDVIFLGNVKGTAKYQKMLALAKNKRYNIGAIAVEPPDIRSWFTRLVNRNLRGDQKVPVKDAWASTKTYGEGLDLLEKYGNTKIIESKGGLFTDKIAGSSFRRSVRAVGGRGDIGERLGTTRRQIVLEQRSGRATEITKKTRGFIASAKEVIPEADKIAGQYIPRGTDQLAIKAKNLIASDFATAERIALTQSDDNAVAIASELLKKYADDAAKAVDPAQASALYDKAADIANTLAPKLTEQGRAIQAASILGRLTPEGQVRFAAKSILRWNEQFPNKAIPLLSGKQAEDIVKEMAEINKMVEGTEKAMRFQKLQNYIQDLVPSPVMKKVIAVWKAGLLTGIKTQGLNIFSNLFHGTSEIIKDVPASIVDSAASLFTGQRTKTFTIRGVGSGLVEGFEKGVRYFKTGFDERNIGAKLDYKRVNFGKGAVAKAFQTYTDTVYRFLGAQDQPFYYGALSRSLMDQALAQGKNAGFKGKDLVTYAEKLVEAPTEQMIRYAVADATTAVFQNKTALGEAARKIQNIPGIGEIVLPFGRTPSAVAMQIINYSPVGIAKTIIENIGKGKFDQRLFSQGLGRGLTGTAILAIGMELAKPIGEY